MTSDSGPFMRPTRIGFVLTSDEDGALRAYPSDEEARKAELEDGYVFVRVSSMLWGEEING